MNQAAYDCILSRRSIKKYKPDAVSKEALDRILQAGTFAATGRNLQSPIILAVTNKKLRDQLSAMNARIMGREGTDPFYGAPVVLVVLADRNISTHVYDGSLVMGNLLLAAHAEGLGACWIHRAKEEFDSEEGKEILASLGITGDYEGIGHCIVGYPEAEPSAPPERKKNYIYHID